MSVLVPVGTRWVEQTKRRSSPRVVVVYDTAVIGAGKRVVRIRNITSPEGRASSVEEHYFLDRFKPYEASS